MAGQTRAQRERFDTGAAAGGPARDVPHSGLPFALTSLLGREHELAALGDLLRHADVRQVTVTGPAGVGKTRLALEVAWSLVDAFEEVVFVSLAPLRDPALVIPAIAEALGAAEDASRSPFRATAARLGGVPALLVLDNLEHLPSAAPDIADLLAATPALKVLATSRSPLQIRGERVFPLAPLSLPAASESIDAATLSANPAVALFIERARAADPSFPPTPQDAAIVAEICRRLDGLPLAIELAAARIEPLSPEALLGRLDHRLTLLTGGLRDLPERLRTLRAAIAWSVDLLSPAAQSLFVCLAVFVGGASLRAVETVFEPEDSSAIDELAELINSNLLQRSTGLDEPRFAMFETIREFALEMLADRGETETARALLARFCLTLAEAAFPHLNGGGRETWLRRIDSEHDNIRAALAWLVERGDADSALRLTGWLWRFWWWRSHLTEGRRWIEAALALPGAEAPSAARARALTGAGALSEALGDYRTADARHKEALAVWDLLGDTGGRATTLLFRWLLAFNDENQDRMTALATESLDAFRRLGDDWGVAMSLLELGVGAMRREEWDAATTWAEQGAQVFDQLGDGWGVALCRGVLGNICIDRGEYNGARRLLRQSLDELLLLDDRWGIATILPAAARLAMSRHDAERAVRVSAASVALHESLSSPLKPPFRQVFERNLALARTALGEEAFARAWAAGRSATPAEIIQSAFAADEVAERPAEASILSAREIEVLQLIAKHRSDQQIADALFISYRTVTSHVTHIRDKLGVATRHEAVDEARRLGLL